MEESCCSGKISPNSKPCERDEVGEIEFCGCSCGGDFGGRFVMDLEAFGFSLTELRGLPIRLAKDWELFETWSSATNLALC